MKLLICGGHASPALAVIDQLQKKHKEINIIFVGKQYNFPEKTESFEYQEVKKRKVEFINFTSGRLTRILSLDIFINAIMLFWGTVQAFLIIYKKRPRYILSFGGYLALPICCVGYIFKIPIITHEQTISPGLTNKIIAIFAKKILISFPETKDKFNHKITIFVGNPIRQQIFSLNKNYQIKTKKPIILVLGASLGSHSINMLIKQIVPSLTKKYFIIHQTGNIKSYDDYSQLQKLNYKDYLILKHISSDEIGSYYHRADLVISRSGASTVIELIALKKPAVLIPLPWSANQEQKLHANLLKKNNAALVFNQDDNPQLLKKTIDEIYQNKDKYKVGYQNLQYLFCQNAAETIVKEILSKN